MFIIIIEHITSDARDRCTKNDGCNNFQDVLIINISVIYTRRSVINNQSEYCHLVKKFVPILKFLNIFHELLSVYTSFLVITQLKVYE